MSQNQTKNNTMQVSLLLYDIPETSKYPNPSGVLRRRALRVNLSCWIVDQQRIPWTILEEMTSSNVDWHLWDFDSGATQKILQKACISMRRELEENAAREKDSLDRAERQRDEVLNNPESTHTDVVRANNKYEKDRTLILKRSEKLVKDLEEAANSFNLDMTQFPFGRNYERVNALRTLQGSRAQLYAELAEKMKDTPIGKAASESEVPAEILADYAEEHGHNVDVVREAFTNSSNGHGHNNNGSQRILSSSDKMQPQVQVNPLEYIQPKQGAISVTYRVSTSNGMRVVQSRYSDAQCGSILRDSENRFAQELASRVNHGRGISTNQRAWLHVLACETMHRYHQVRQEQEITTSTIPSAEVKQEVKQEETIITLLTNREGITYSQPNRIFSGEDELIGLGTVHPERFNLKSHKTAKVVVMVKDKEQNNLRSFTDYSTEDGQYKFRVMRSDVDF